MLFSPQILAGRRKAVLPATVSYRTTVKSTSSTDTYSFAATDIGAAAADRYVYVCVGGRNGAAATVRAVTAVTIGGVSASLVVGTSATGSSQATTLDFYRALVPTGTTATIDVTFAATISECTVAVWAVTGQANLSAYATAADNASLITSTISLNTVAGGFVLAGGCGNNGPSFTWAGVTERYDASTTIVYSFADASALTSSESPRTVTATRSITSNTGLGLGLAVSFAP